MNYIVFGLFVYPIKSCAGTWLDRAVLDGRGIIYDRNWVVTDTTGKFLTQRQFPQLALVRPAIRGRALELTAPGAADLSVPIFGQRGRPVGVTVWKDTCRGEDQGDEAARWFEAIIGQQCRLVRIAENDTRAIHGAGGRAAFADSYPLLVASESSLAALTRRVGTPVPVDRFRANIVIAGAPAFDEDTWDDIKIGGIPVHVDAPCDRCPIVATDQHTGARDPRSEPLRTLGRFRRRIKGVQRTGISFGVNASHLETGTIHLGDLVTIVTRRISPGFQAESANNDILPLE